MMRDSPGVRITPRTAQVGLVAGIGMLLAGCASEEPGLGLINAEISQDR